MRQGQQNNNKRMRGRNNRKGPNPLTRSYESNGPDVKIRGTAHHVAEKYLSLARDAQSSGDRVAAESYLQHAEHYFRIIATAQQQFTQQPQAGGAPGQFVGPEEDDDEEPMQNDRFYSNIPAPQQPQFNQNNNGQPYRGESNQNYSGNRDQQPSYANGNGNGSEGGGHRNNNQQPQPQQNDAQPSYDDTGFGGEPPAFVAGGQPNVGGNEQGFNNGQQQPGSTEGGYRRRRRSGRDRPRFQDRGQDSNNPAPAAPAGEGGGGGSDE